MSGRKETVGSLERRRFGIIDDDKAVERKETERRRRPRKGEGESGAASRRNAVCLVN